MEIFNLGSVALRRPLGIGTLQWGTTWVDDKMVKGGRIPDDVVDAVVRECLDAGVTFFDSAEGYGGGTSEERLGRAVRATAAAAAQASSGGKCAAVGLAADAAHSDEPVLATKFLPTFWRLSRHALLQAARRSLATLGLAQQAGGGGRAIPLYFIHTPVHWLPVEFWVEAACDAKDAGLVENIGVSNFDADQVLRAHAIGLRRGHTIAANQVMYGLLNHGNARLQETIRVCRELGIAIVAFSPIGQGLLTDKFSEDSFQTNRVARMTRVNRSDLSRLRGVLAEVAKETGKSMAQVALNWVICHDCVPLIGCRSLRQARDTLGALGWRLDVDQVHRLDEVALAHSTLDGKKWKRVFFANLFGVVMVCCRFLRWFQGSSYRGPPVLEPNMASH